MGPGRGAQRRRFGEPGLSSAASNSMGRFNVAPHAIPRRGQGPDAATTAARTQLLSYGSQAKPAPMAPPAPGSRIGPASCDVTGVRHRPAERGGKPEEGHSRRSAGLGSALGAPPWRKWAGLGIERGRLATLGRPPPPPLLGPPLPWLGWGGLRGLSHLRGRGGGGE